MGAGKSRVKLLVNTSGSRRGDVIEVESDLVDGLLADRLAVVAEAGAKVTVRKSDAPAKAPKRAGSRATLTAESDAPVVD